MREKQTAQAKQHGSRDTTEEIWKVWLNHKNKQKISNVHFSPGAYSKTK